MKIIKIDNCKKCIYLTWQEIWKLDTEVGTGTENNSKYTGKDELYCNLKKKKKDLLGKFITTAGGDCDFIEIPKWCPLEDYKDEN